MIVHQSSASRAISMLIVDSCCPEHLRTTASAPTQAPTLLILSPRPSNANGAPRSRPRGPVQLLQPSSCRVNPTQSTMRPKSLPRPVFLSWDLLPLPPLQIRDLPFRVSLASIPLPLRHSALCLVPKPLACCPLPGLDVGPNRMEVTQRTKSP